MKQSSFETIQEKLTLQDQTEAHLFVGKFITEFTSLEWTIDRVIISYFMVDVSLNPQRNKEVFDKNQSINDILEHSVLGHTYVSFQMKTEMLRAIIQATTPIFYKKHGKKILHLIGKLQKMRNLIAHYQTYVYNEEIFIAKPRFHFDEDKNHTKKGGVMALPSGKYKTYYEKVQISDEIKIRIYNQIATAGRALAYYSIRDSGVLSMSDEQIEKNLENIDFSKGGVIELKILDH